MNVELLYHTPNPERAIATAARLCYAPVGAAELMETMADEQVSRVLRTIMTGGHFSTLEHASFTFAVDGVSRALTHQLVRHRLASYNQQSQRYVKFADSVPVVVPPSVMEDQKAMEIFHDAIEATTRAYARLVDMGVEADKSPIRGGTDGATLSFRGLPCPNLGTGGHNFHGRKEFVCIQSMDKTVELLTRLVQAIAKEPKTL